MSIGTLKKTWDQNEAIPEWLIGLQCMIFVVLWTVTMLPNVLIFRNIALILGAIIGLYVTIKYRKELTLRGSLPMLLIALLFLWVSLHLLFIGKNHVLQWAEYRSLWKRALLGSLFALGLGLSLIRSKRSYSGLIFAGLCGPVAVYYFKFFTKLSSAYFGFSAPEAMMSSSLWGTPFYIPKISYTFFCLPALAVSLGYLEKVLTSKGINWKIASIYMALIISILGIFYLENIKNGFVYSFLLALIFFISLLRGGVREISWKGCCILAILGITMMGFFLNNIYSNDSWKTLSADSNVAIHMQPSEVWAETIFTYPLNEYGRVVSLTNFDRIFYLKTAVTFVKEYPLGYGLVQSSFGHIARESFPNAPLIQSHSGWIDVTLGLGIPGTLLLLVASILAMYKVANVPSLWSIFGVWSLLSIVLFFLTTEVSQKNYVDTFVWLVVMVGTLGLGSAVQNKSEY